MDKDRTEICKIIGNMLDSPDKHGIYPTSTCFSRLENYVEGQRAEAIGWCHGFCCLLLDKGDDPRTINIPELYAQSRNDLGKA